MVEILENTTIMILLRAEFGQEILAIPIVLIILFTIFNLRDSKKWASSSPPDSTDEKVDSGVST